MKNIFLMIIGLFVIAASTELFALKADVVIGNVTMNRSGQQLGVVKDAVFNDGDIVFTGDKSYLVMISENGDRITVKEKSRVLIDKKAVTSGSVSVIRGTLNAKFNKIKSGDDRAKVYTPTMVCGVRGTEFTVAVSDSGESIVQMSEGKLEVYNPSGTVSVSGNENSKSAPGDKPEKSKTAVNPEQWKTEQDTVFKNNPEDPIAGYSEQAKILNERSSQSDGEIKNISSSVSTLKTEKQLSSTEANIKSEQTKTADDYMLNKSSSEALDQIMKDLPEDQKEILNKYSSLKSEINKVLEQQQRNLEEINKVRAAYQKAKDEILNRYKEDVKDIKNRTKETK